MSHRRMFLAALEVAVAQAVDRNLELAPAKWWIAQARMAVDGLNIPAARRKWFHEDLFEAARLVTRNPGHSETCNPGTFEAFLDQVYQVARWVDPRWNSGRDAVEAQADFKAAQRELHAPA